MTTALPPGWETTTLGEVFQIVGGATPSTSEPSFWGGDIPWVTPDDLATHDAVEVAGGRRFITTTGYDSTSTHLLPKGAVLFSSRAPIGYTAIAAQPLCTNQGFKSLIPPEGVDSRYVYWYLRHATPAIREMGSGTTFKEMSKKRMANVPFVLAPSREQHRIVAAIEEHFSRLDAVESTLERGLKSVAAMRMSLLRDAFKVDGTLPHDWRRTEIGEVAKVQLGRQRSPQHHAGPRMRPYLRAANVTWAGLDLDDVKQMNFDEGDFETYCLWPGDLLLNEASGSPNEVGKPAVWNGEIADCCFQNTLLRLQARDINPGYLYWYCYMAATTGCFGEAGRGVNIRHLGKQGLARFPIPVAPRIEQEHMVTRLQEQFRQASECEAAIQLALTRTHALRRSILTMAFAGRLVPRDRGIEPFAFGGWLARKNPNDEPASVMLEGSEAGTR